MRLGPDAARLGRDLAVPSDTGKGLPKAFHRKYVSVRVPFRERVRGRVRTRRGREKGEGEWGGGGFLLRFR